MSPKIDQSLPNMVTQAAILKIATSRTSMQGIMGIPLGHYLDPHGGSSAKIGELACMSPPAAILTGLLWRIRKTQSANKNPVEKRSTL